MTPVSPLARAAILALALVPALALPAHAQDIQPPPTTTLSDVEVSPLRAPTGETFVVERAEVSPDGSRIAYVAAWGNVRKMRVEALDGSLAQTADLEGADLRDIMWAGNDHVLLTVMTQSIETLDVENGLMSVIAWNVRTNSYETLLRDRSNISTLGNLSPTRLRTAPRVMAIVFERPAVRVRDGRVEAVVDTISFDGSCRYDLYSVDLDTGGPVREVEGVQRAQALILDEAGEPAALQQTGRIKLRRGVGWRIVPDGQFGGPAELMGLGRGDTVLVRIGDAPSARWVEVSRRTGRIEAEITPEGLREVMPLHDDQTGALLGLAGVDAEGRHGYVFFRPELAQAWPAVRGAFAGDDVQLASWSADFRILVVYAERAGGADFHLIDLARSDARMLAPSFAATGVVALDRTGTGAAVEIRRAAAARIQDPRRLCTDVRRDSP